MTLTTDASGEAPAGRPAEDAVAMRRAGKRFGDVWAVRDIDLQVRRGTVLGLIGPSGCGKTTTIRLMTGAYRPDAGEVTVLGTAPTRMSTADRQRLGYLPQQPVLFPSLSVRENLHFHAALNGVRLRRRKRLTDVLELVDLSGDGSKKVSEISGGMQRRVALAATLLHQPELLFLDEPTAGLDPILRQHLWEEFHELSERGHTLVVTTQYIGEAAHCDVVGLLTEGELIHLETPEDLRRLAAGGDLVEITLDRPVDDTTLQRLGTELGADRDPERRSPATMRIVVPDGAEVVRSVPDVAASHDLGVGEAREVELDYDEVFLRLVERWKDESADDAPATCPVEAAGTPGDRPAG